jgi:hypothetical protein
MPPVHGMKPRHAAALALVVGWSAIRLAVQFRRTRINLG